jgi:hypothetical protein
MTVPVDDLKLTCPVTSITKNALLRLEVKHPVDEEEKRDAY